MTAVLFGLLTATAWGAATLSTARSSRLLGATSTVTWISFIGLAITLPFIVIGGPAAPVDAESFAWLGLSGIGYVCGLLLMYTAVRSGPVGIAAPIASLEGAVAALLAVVAGEQLAVGTLAVMAVIVVGLLLATLDLDAERRVASSISPRFVALALAAAFMFGLGLYAGGRVSQTVPTAWVVASGRLMGALLVGIPVIATRRLVITRTAAPWIIVASVAEVVGYAFFVTGAQTSIGITAVLASQFAAIAVIGAYLFFGERFTRSQRGGVVLIAIGVACLAALQA